MFKTLLITENYIKSIVDSFLIDKEESYHLNKFMLSFNGSYVDFLHYTLYNYINYISRLYSAKSYFSREEMKRITDEFTSYLRWEDVSLVNKILHLDVFDILYNKKYYLGEELTEDFFSDLYNSILDGKNIFVEDFEINERLYEILDVVTNCIYLMISDIEFQVLSVIGMTDESLEEDLYIYPELENRRLLLHIRYDSTPNFLDQNSQREDVANE